MATILNFDVSRRRQAPAETSRTAEGPARVLIFTGVRRERLHPRTHAPRHEPMFDDPLPRTPRFPDPMRKDPAPGKPGGRKPRRGKAG